MINNDIWSSNLTNKYNPQERAFCALISLFSSNLTNKYNPQERAESPIVLRKGSNLTNKYNPQEPSSSAFFRTAVQILPINTILKNVANADYGLWVAFKSYQ